MEFTRTALSASGFMGFVPFAELPTADVPEGPRVYVVLRTGVSPADLFTDEPCWLVQEKTPTVALEFLEAAWGDKVSVLTEEKRALARAVIVDCVKGCPNTSVSVQAKIGRWRRTVRLATYRPS